MKQNRQLKLAGINSQLRRIILSSAHSSLETLPDTVYRAMVPRAAMLTRPATADLISSDSAQLFMGPGRALLAYPVQNGLLFNIAITATGKQLEAADARRVGKWDIPVSKEALMELFHGFCPLVQTLIDLVETCAKWTIAEVQPLERWSSASGRAVLIGDAAHAMSPHLAQGAAMAIEDAAVLTECLRLVTEPKEGMTKALLRYETIRKPRVARVASYARQNGASMVMGDGPEQKDRDRRFARTLEANPGKPPAKPTTNDASQSAPAWPSPPVVQWLYGLDVIEDAKTRLQEMRHLQHVNGLGGVDASDVDMVHHGPSGVPC